MPADPLFGPQCGGGKEATCFGGAARQATAIKAAQVKAAARGADTLMLHAGDQLSGTVWDTVYTKRGVQIAPEFLDALGVQAFVSVRTLRRLPPRMQQAPRARCGRRPSPAGEARNDRSLRLVDDRQPRV
jgi:hypothetical protein